MSKVLLHIGHAKTGSSFLQSVFAANRDILLAQGIHYPASAKTLKMGEKGNTTSGNGGRLFAEDAELSKMLRVDGDVLFSSESLFTPCSDPVFLRKIETLSRQNDKKLSVLLFLRDPIEHQVAGHLQYLQMGLTCMELNKFFVSDAITRQCNQFRKIGSILDTCEANEIEITVRNYTRIRHEILDTVKQFLGIELSEEFSIPQKTVNRSISAQEIGIQIALQKAFSGLLLPEKRNYMLDLANATSEMTVAPPKLDDEAKRVFVDGISDEFEKINRRLPRGHQYQLQYAPRQQTEPSTDEKYGAQLGASVVQSTLSVLALNVGPDAKKKILSIIFLQLNPTLEHLRVYSDLLLEDKEYRPAAEVLQKIVDSDERPMNAYKLALCLLKLEEKKGAQKYAVVAFEREPTNVRYASTAFNLTLRLPDLAAAAKILETAKQNQIQADLCLFWEYKLARAKNLPQVALQSIDAALAISPDNQKYLAARNRMTAE